MLKILIVEDDRELRQLFAHVLLKNGYTVKGVSNGQEGLDALKAAAAAGVQIELVIPGIKASFFLDPVTTYYCGQLLGYGAKIYKYQGYIHAKTMVVDDELCCIGSVNMDVRSLKVDDEICGVFYANPTVHHYTKIYDADIERCSLYELEQFVSRGTWERFLESFFLMFAPLM